ncbi:Light-independent protochlorophyllide reductase subunit B [Dissostichus eleginoides]|uniref:Light-independent protochlorophyllide reductase subunit B n=1 Tax=Dissostichus eleginoides TaxID=100907 RepID=A0AAD9BRB1_DISEL|nr:Light-independent protochlorophyllide reductase subunit B [Dissostichus eleginoides]
MHDGQQLAHPHRGYACHLTTHPDLAVAEDIRHKVPPQLRHLNEIQDVTQSPVDSCMSPSSLGFRTRCCVVFAQSPDRSPGRRQY